MHLSKEELRKLELRAAIRREEARAVELTHHYVSKRLPINVVANKKAISMLRHRYPGTTYKHWMVLFGIAYVADVTEKIIGKPYFLFGVANEVFFIEKSWHKIDFFNYWESHHVITMDRSILKRLEQSGHPWAEINKGKGRKWSQESSYLVNRSALEAVLADYAEELEAFYHKAHDIIYNTPIFKDPWYGTKKAGRKNRQIERRNRMHRTDPDFRGIRETDPEGNRIDWVERGVFAAKSTPGNTSNGSTKERVKAAREKFRAIKKAYDERTRADEDKARLDGGGSAERGDIKADVGRGSIKGSEPNTGDRSASAGTEEKERGDKKDSRNKRV